MPATTRSITSEQEVERSLRAVMVTNMYPTEAAPDDGTPVADELKGLRDAGLHVDLVHLPREGGGRRVYLGLARRIRRLVARTRPDILLVMYGGVMADVVTRTVRDIPVVVTIRGTDLLGGKGKGVVHGVSRRYGVVASRRAAVRAAGVVVKSRNLFDALPPEVDRSRVWIVPDGIDLQRFRPRDRNACRAELGWDPGRRHVLFPGSPARPEKRFALAAAALALLRADGVEVELHALEGVSHDAVATWLNAADVLLLTSTHEGSPNSVKEALACNLPIVSVDVGDVRERIAGIEGCHVAEPDPHDVAAKVASVLERDRPVAGRGRVAELSLERVTATLCEIYATVIGDASKQKSSDLG